MNAKDSLSLLRFSLIGMFDFIFVFVRFLIYPLYIWIKNVGQDGPLLKILVYHPGKMWALARSMAQKKTQPMSKLIPHSNPFLIETHPQVTSP